MISTIIFFGYFLILFLISKIINKNKTSNENFYNAGRKSNWLLVSIGMVGASFSGVSFVSVPGMVLKQNFEYMQMVLGFILGYIIIAKCLLPILYKLNSPSIYQYLNNRFGQTASKTSSVLFIISKLLGSAVKLFAPALIIHKIGLETIGFPFWATISIIIILIFLYSFQGGIKTLVYTDVIQTICFVGAIIVIMIQLFSLIENPVESIVASTNFRFFEFDNISSPRYFFKSFLSGAFVVIAMTGLDQDMMQKNLSISTLKQSQKNMILNGFLYTPINFLFLLTGLLILIFAQNNNITLPERSDEILAYICNNHLSKISLILFSIGLSAAAFSSADSALCSLTTSIMIDIIGKKEDKNLRIKIHLLLSLIMIFVILFLDNLQSKSAIDMVYTLVSYTYGPLLGLFTFGIFTKINLKDKYIWIVCTICPIICYVIENICKSKFGYNFGYELLILNGFLNFLGLSLLKTKNNY